MDKANRFEIPAPHCFLVSNRKLGKAWLRWKFFPTFSKPIWLLRRAWNLSKIMLHHWIALYRAPHECGRFNPVTKFYAHTVSHFTGKSYPQKKNLAASNSQSFFFVIVFYHRDMWKAKEYVERKLLLPPRLHSLVLSRPRFSLRFESNFSFSSYRIVRFCMGSKRGAMKHFEFLFTHSGDEKERLLIELMLVYMGERNHIYYTMYSMHCS